MSPLRRLPVLQRLLFSRLFQVFKALLSKSHDLQVVDFSWIAPRVFGISQPQPLYSVHEPSKTFANIRTFPSIEKLYASAVAIVLDMKSAAGLVSLYPRSLS